MNFLIVISILISVTLSVIAQLFLKYGMSSTNIQSELINFDYKSPFTIIFNPYVFVGLSCYLGSMVTWLYVLTKVDVSKAYPFVGLGFIGTMLFATVFLNEPLTLLKICGTLLVVAGVYLISMS